MTSHGSIRGRFAVDGSGVRGHAYDIGDLARRLAVELVVDGWPVDLARADDFSVEAAGVGDGCYGFGFRLPDAVLGREGTIEIRVANTGEVVGAAVSLPAAQATAGTAAGRVTWAGGLRLTGWIETPPGDEAAAVRLVVERRVVAEAPARGFVTVVQGATRRTKARFDVRLPAAFADGRVHRVAALDHRGRPLEGSPCAVLAFTDGLRDALMDRGGLVDGDPRVDLIDRLLPPSVPFSELDAWRDRHPVPPTPRMAPDAPVAVILLGEDVESTIASLDGQSHRAWFALSAPAVRGPGTFDPAAVAGSLAAEPCEAVVVVPAGARLHPEALARLGALAVEEGAVVYPDAAMRTAAGLLPLLWPAFDRERQWEQGYAALAFAAASAAVSAALRHGAGSPFALFDALGAAATPVHLPEVLVDLPRPHPLLGRALAAARESGPGQGAEPADPDRETGLPRVRLRGARTGGGVALAVVAPEPWLPDLARAARAVAGDAERLLVSHRPLPVPPGWKTVVVAGGRNPSRLRDAALASARAPRLLLLDAGVEPEEGGEAAELSGGLAGGAVAAGGLLLDEDGLVASAGLVLGPGFTAVPAFAGLDPETGGYAGALALTRNCGALDASALLLDRAAASAAGGFDAALYPEHHGAVDLCLRLRAAGGRLVVAPRARFVRRRAWRSRSATRAQAAELEILRRRWGEDLADDPFYHPGLNRDAGPFSALAWPPGHRGPRRPEPRRERTTKPETP